MSLRPHVSPEEKFPRKVEVESCQDPSVLFLLLGLLFVDLFLCLRLFRVTLLQHRGRGFGWNDGRVGGPAEATAPRPLPRTGIFRLGAGGHGRRHTGPPGASPLPGANARTQTRMTDRSFEKTLVGVCAPNTPSVLERPLHRRRFLLSCPCERELNALPHKHPDNHKGTHCETPRAGDVELLIPSLSCPSSMST